MFFILNYNLTHSGYNNRFHHHLEATNTPPSHRQNGCRSVFGVPNISGVSKPQELAWTALLKMFWVQRLVCIFSC